MQYLDLYWLYMVFKKKLLNCFQQKGDFMSHNNIKMSFNLEIKNNIEELFLNNLYNNYNLIYTISYMNCI